MADIKINEKLVVSQTGTAEPVLASGVTGIPAAGITGVLPVGVTGGTGLDKQSVEIWYEAFPAHNNASYPYQQEIGEWNVGYNMEVGNHNILGKAPPGFTAVSAIKIGVFNVQGQFANQGIRMRWQIAGNVQAYNTHSLGDTTVATFPGTDTNANYIYEADAFNLTGSNDFEDIIADGDYFTMAFDDLQSHNSAVMGVAITWDF